MAAVENTIKLAESGGEKEEVFHLYKLARGAGASKEHLGYWAEFGYVDKYDVIDPVVREVVLAAVRFRGDELVVVSPFAEEQARNDYREYVRGDGFAPAEPERPEDNLRREPVPEGKWAGRPANPGGGWQK